MQRARIDPHGSRRRCAGPRRDRGGASVGALVFVAVAALLGSCASGRDLVVSTAGAAEFAGLDEVEARIAAARLDPKAVDLAALATGLDALADKPSLSAAYQARLEALRGEVALLRDLRADCARYLAAIKALPVAEPGAWLLEAWLAPSPAAAAAALEAGILAAPAGAGRLLCELGLLRYAAGKYKEAAALLDEGLATVAPAWKAYYEPRREAAFALRDEPAPVPGKAGEAPKPPVDPGSALTAGGLVEILAEQTDYLAFAGKDRTTGELLQILAERGFFLEGVPAAAKPLARKDLAFFLLRLSAVIENEPALLTRYRDKYDAKAKAGKAAKSPLADVPLDVPWFDAALFVVERELMELPDGARFDPEAPTRGLDLLAAIKKLRLRYR